MEDEFEFLKGEGKQLQVLSVLPNCICSEALSLRIRNETCVVATRLFPTHQSPFPHWDGLPSPHPGQGPKLRCSSLGVLLVAILLSQSFTVLFSWFINAHSDVWIFRVGVCTLRLQSFGAAALPVLPNQMPSDGFILTTAFHLFVLDAIRAGLRQSSIAHPFWICLSCPQRAGTAPNPNLSCGHHHLSTFY